MSAKETGQPLGGRSNWVRAVPVAVVLLAVAVAASWWLWGARNASGGGPRLAVDRTEVDLGDFPFDAPARAVFTLTNTGDSPLKLAQDPPVTAVKGC